MIVFENKGFETRSDCPDGDWTGTAKYVVADGTALADRIRSCYPHYEFVVERGTLVDVVATQPPAPTPAELHLRYEAKTVELVRERYSGDEEAKVVREYLANLTGAAAAFQSYNEYVIQCKTQAQLAVYGQAPAV